MGRTGRIGAGAALAATLASCSTGGGTGYTGYGSNIPNGAYLNLAQVALVRPSPQPGRQVVAKRAAELVALQDATWSRGVLGAVLATATAGIPHTDANGPDPLVWVVSLEAAPDTYLFEYVDGYSGRALGASGGPLPGFHRTGPTLPLPTARPPSASMDAGLPQPPATPALAP
jgi:hypothetical protein